MEAINDASKYVAQSRKLLQDYIDSNNFTKSEALLLAARDLLTQTLEVLAKEM